MASSDTESSVSATQFGFSVGQGVDWYSYHSKKQQAQWSVAHDVGAGCGIAEKLLVEQGSLPKSRFKFYKESGEESAVDLYSVNMIAVCESIHWMDTDRAIQQFAKELVSGGTLIMTYYSRALIEDNEPAQVAWKAAWDLLAEKGQGDLFTSAYKVANSGMDTVELPQGQWGNVERVYINAPKGSDAFKLDNRTSPSKVGPHEKQTWEKVNRAVLLTWTNADI
ncbi:S-adenosyl-L-methionine-dependent methyltransferase [Xylaria scruposa]|nr:S-adenosyl-L-methionine-dependent methyltransferase [Xylaria scruposa]